MPPIEIKPDVYWIGVNDRTTDLFEGLWPITQEGVSYNTYSINDERRAIVARFGSYGWSGGAQRHFERIITPLRWELVDSFEFVGSPTEEDLRHGERFGAAFARLIKAQTAGAQE